MGTLSYIKNYFKDRAVASVTPSSRFVVRRVCKRMDFSTPRVIVEYGPGEGVFSKYILKQMTPDCQLLLVETNEEFVQKLQGLAQDPRVSVFNDTAENVEAILEEAGEPAADYVLSGIPFSFFDEETRHDLIQTTRGVLKPGGKFLVYQHYNHMEQPLRQHFEHVESDFELFNIPPIRIHSAMKDAKVAV